MTDPKLNELGKLISQRIERKHRMKKGHSESERWDKCLHVEGEIWAYEHMWGELMQKGLLTEPDEKPNLSTCPGCDGVADNGHNRSYPPEPYYCTKCEGEK